MIFTSLLLLILGAFTLLSWKNPKLGITLLFALLPTYLIRFSFLGIPSTLLEALTLITIGIAIIRRIIWARHNSHENLTIHINAPEVFIAFIFIAAFLSTVMAPNLPSALGILKAYFIEPLLLILIVQQTMTTQKDKEALWNSLIASASFIGLLAILQVLTHIGIPSAWIIENRATSIFPYPNAVGLFLAPIVTFAIVNIIQNETRQRRRLYNMTQGVMIILMLAGIIVAKTEAALIAIPASLFIITLISPKITNLKKGILAIGVIAVTIITLLSPTILSKLTLHDTSGLVRRSQWKETVTMLADHPLFGAGLNGYPSALAPYHDATFYEIFQYPHNILLNVWSELGLMGLIGLIGLIFSITKLTWANRHNPKTLALTAALLTLLIHGLVDVPFFKNDLAILTMFLILEVTQLLSSPGNTIVDKK